jgi:hypothetical protein
MRARLGGKPLWMPNTVVIRAGGALLIPQGRMEWGSGSILERDGGCFQVILDSNQVMGLTSNFGIMCSVVRRTSRTHF